VPGVAEINGVSVIVADEGIKVAVAIKIREDRCCGAANIAEIEGIAGGSLKGRSQGGAGVAEINGVSVIVADEGIKVAVAIKISKDR
jgi:hypothetical protein